MSIAEMIQRIKQEYRDFSVGCMKDLCDYAGVTYRDYEQAEYLIKDMNDAGYNIIVKKYRRPGECVGQFLYLTDYETGEYVKGFHVWVDFKDNYTVQFSPTDFETILEYTTEGPEGLLN